MWIPNKLRANKLHGKRKSRLVSLWRQYCAREQVIQVRRKHNWDCVEKHHSNGLSDEEVSIEQISNNLKLF